MITILSDLDMIIPTHSESSRQYVYVYSEVVVHAAAGVSHNHNNIHGLIEGPKLIIKVLHTYIELHTYGVKYILISID